MVVTRKKDLETWRLGDGETWRLGDVTKYEKGVRMDDLNALFVFEKQMIAKRPVFKIW